ncbi:MAG: ABC transporter permease [Deltaproteobacteria bacterium]|nr:ABC transporter permease [Deltaproteobacteria bacterium]
MNSTSRLEFSRPAPDTIQVRLAGAWSIKAPQPDAAALQGELAGAGRPVRLVFHAGGVEAWDSSLLTFLVRLKNLCLAQDIAFDPQGLPEGVPQLLDLAAKVPERQGARREVARVSFFSRVGEEAVDFARGAREMLDFVGEAALAGWGLLRGRAGFRGRDLWLIMQECGVQALPIVSLISLLVGMILAFVGAVQLVMFGAQIYVASLVGVAMVRVMGAIMTGIIMAGRTGAAFAAQLGTMQVNEEIDALRTLGMSPMNFLVLPRMLALALMMPLLCLYADLMGVLGGFVVGLGMLDLGLVEYFQQTQASISLTDFWVGIFQASVFGVLVAVSGCMRGMDCGRSASAVGEAATSAVVTGIVSIIVATALITIMCNVIGI